MVKNLRITKESARAVVPICPECKSEVYGNVCKNCGLVFESSPIINLPKLIVEEERNKENQFEGWKWDYSDLEDSTVHSNKTSNKELKKAFKREHVNDSKYGRKYLNGYYEIKRICGYLQLNKNISNTGIYFLRILIDKEYMSKTRRKYATFSALIIIAARLNHIPFSYEQIYEYTEETPKSIKNAYYSILKELHLKIPKFMLLDYLDYHCNLLGLSFNQKKKILGLARIFQKNIRMNGKDPVGYSAGLIRYVTGLKRLYLSKMLYISEPVITWRYSEIKNFFGDLNTA